MTADRRRGQTRRAGSPLVALAGPAWAADPDAWDRFVASTPLAPYLQSTPWAEVKARNGWRATRVAVGEPGRAEVAGMPEQADAIGLEDRGAIVAREPGGSGAVGIGPGVIAAQVLSHAIGPLPWSVGYAPRGPVASVLTLDGVAAWTDALRAAARRLRLSHVVIDPEIEAGGPEAAWFVRAGWRPCPSPQPARSRWIDLARTEDELWDELRAKWRQYVQKARRGGIAVIEAGPERLGDFYAIYVDTARRAGFTYRSEGTYRAVYEAFSGRGRARLLFAVDRAGEPQATLMLVGWGSRVVEPYGGMTRAGADSRANYLLKWEAIRSSRAGGYALYDMWGLSHAGIEHFKTGFGGRAVEYIGGLELPVRPLLRRGVEAAQALRVLVARRRLERQRQATADGAEP